MRTTFTVAIVVVLFTPHLLAKQAKVPTTTVPSAPNQTKTKTGLIYETVAKGSGAIARRGDTVRIHETLSLPDGRVIFNSREKNQTVTIILGGNQVIPGVDEGVTGMRVGERRRLLVPPSLDGRTFDPSFIPPDAIRHYDIELVEIIK
jgi:FKBP-type peptidyl-prolyl cis-trans isomerase